MIRRKNMSYFILNSLTINEKKNEVFFKGGHNNTVPRENSRIELEGKNFGEKIKSLASYILSGQIQMGNLSKNMIKYQYAFIKAMEELNITHLVQYWDATPEEKEKIEEEFPKTFLKYYNEKEGKEKYIVVNNDIRWRKMIFRLSAKYLPKKRYFSWYDFDLENDGRAGSENVFGYKKATVIKSILGDNHHLEKLSEL